MTNGLYQIRVPDPTDYWVEMVKCRHACPVHTDACGYVTSIAEGRYATTSSDFTALTGKLPESFRDFLVRVAPGMRTDN